MVDSKVFLQSHISKQSSNTSNGVNVQLKGKRKLLPTTDMSESVSQYELRLLGMKVVMMWKSSIMEMRHFPRAQ